ncbi:alpha/beta hydrolase, partial [Streptomyces tricolor]
MQHPRTSTTAPAHRPHPARPDRPTGRGTHPASGRRAPHPRAGTDLGGLPILGGAAAHGGV